MCFVCSCGSLQTVYNTSLGRTKACLFWKPYISFVVESNTGAASPMAVSMENIADTGISAA